MVICERKPKPGSSHRATASSISAGVASGEADIASRSCIQVSRQTVAPASPPRQISARLHSHVRETRISQVSGGADRSGVECMSSGKHVLWASKVSRPGRDARLHRHRHEAHLLADGPASLLQRDSQASHGGVWVRQPSEHLSP